MRVETLPVETDITIRAHIGDKLFTTEAIIAKITTKGVILRLRDVERFDMYAERTESFSLCYKRGFEMNNISAEVEILHSASNPEFISVPGDTELTAISSQRSHARYPYEYDLVISAADEHIQVRGRDVSSKGVGVIARRPLPVGSFVYVDMYNPVTRKSRAFRAQVANCVQKQLGEQFIGLSFISVDQWIVDFIDDLQDKVLQEVE